METYNFLWGKTDYSEYPPEERLTQEIRDFIQWMEPTPDETQIRFFTIMKYTNFIEYIINSGNVESFTKKGFKGKYQVTVAGQGSSFTNFYIPNSDIDLIVLGLPDDINVSDCLFKIVNQLWHTHLISNAIVLKHAKVPIAKIVDRQFGLHIDISIGQINGSLNVPRVINYFEFYPLLRSALMIMKVFTLTNEIHDPAKGGFGSNHMMLIIIFVIQQNPDITTEGELLIAILEFISSKMNIFLTGISTSDGGRFFSKFAIEFEKRWPHTIICQDPQYPDNYYGIRSKQSLLLVEKCQKALEIIKSDLKKIKQTPVNSNTSNFFSKKRLETSYSEYSDNSNDDVQEIKNSENDDDDYDSSDVVEIVNPSILGRIFIGINVIVKRRKEFNELAALWKLPPREYISKMASRDQNMQRSRSTPNLKKEKDRSKLFNNNIDQRKARYKNYDRNDANRNANKYKQNDNRLINNSKSKTQNAFHKNKRHFEDSSSNKHNNNNNNRQENSNKRRDDRNNRILNRFQDERRKPYKR